MNPRSKSKTIDRLQARFYEHRSRIFVIGKVSSDEIVVTDVHIRYQYLETLQGSCALCGCQIETRARHVALTVWYTRPATRFTQEKVLKSGEHKVVCRDLDACEYRASVGV